MKEFQDKQMNQTSLKRTKYIFVHRLVASGRFLATHTNSRLHHFFQQRIRWTGQNTEVVELIEIDSDEAGTGIASWYRNGPNSKLSDT